MILWRLKVLPFYFLSITTMLIMGLILAFFDKSKKSEDQAESEAKHPILRDSTFLLLLTIFSGFTAISKMISPVASNIVIIGDLLPVIAGLAGTIIFLGRYLNSLQNPKKLPAFLNVLVNYDEIIGYVCITTAVLHLLFSPAILF